MRIGQLAEQTGVSVRALRYYEEQGLLTSTRTESGQRQYAERAIERVRFIQQLYAAGLSSKTIVSLLPCVEAPSHATTRRSVELMQAEHDRIAQQVEELVETRQKLSGLIIAATNSLELVKA
jgi:DNA-binding transcriptional MerR regulator